MRADYRDLPFPDDRFDAVLNLFTSIGYAGREGDTRAFREFRRVLRPGGRLVIETMHRDRLVRIFQAHRWERPMLYIRDDGSGFELPYSIRTYTATELVEMVREAGFEDVSCYGGYDAEELTFDSRLVLVAG